MNEVMINHGTLFYERLNTKFISTASLYLPHFEKSLLLLLDGSRVRRHNILQNELFIMPRETIHETTSL